MDLFASKINHKLRKYISYLPDVQASAIDAFSLQWTNDLFYIFPPFSLAAKILQKNRGRRMYVHLFTKWCVCFFNYAFVLLSNNSRKNYK